MPVTPSSDTRPRAEPMVAMPFSDAADPARYWRQIDPDRPAIVDVGARRRLSYGELDATADAWAAWLQARGCGPGDRVAVLAGTRWELFALLFACLRTGAVLVPLNWRLSPVELAAVVANARPRITLVDPRFSDLHAGLDLNDAATSVGATGAHAGRCAPGPATAGAAAAGPSAARSEADAYADDSPVLMLYTSGSSGAPKGALLGRRQLLFNAVATCFGWGVTAEDTAPVSSPLFHTGGWNVFATPLLYCGGRVVLIDRFEPEAFLAVLAEERCTLALTVPTQLVMLQETAAWGRPLPALRRFMSGGAPLPDSVAARTRAAGYVIREGYGLTECGPNCFAITDAEALELPGAVGRPMPFLAARIVSDGRDVAAGDTGELWLRGPQLFAGYFDAPERTAEAMTGDGWLRTGDLARQGGRGEYYICGRITELYISGGENVYPAEVEAVLAAFPEVIEAAVVGTPDARWGETGTAFVVVRSPSPDTGAAIAAIVAHARTRLAGYKVPRHVRIVASLPRLGSGKVDRRALRQHAESGGPC